MAAHAASRGQSVPAPRPHIFDFSDPLPDTYLICEIRLRAHIERTLHKMAPHLLGLGNPLLDISANVDQAFLDKYEVCGQCQ